MSTLSTVVLLVCSSLGTAPLRNITIDQVELIEYNHFYDEQGRHVFDQLIFYDWSPHESRYQIRDWRLIKTVSQAPYFDAPREIYVATWHDGMTLRQVRSLLLRETWTQYDPELIERSVLPKEQRRELSDAFRRLPTFTVPVNTTNPQR